MDLESPINVMSYATNEALKIGELKDTSIFVQLVNKSIMTSYCQQIL